MSTIVASPQLKYPTRQSYCSEAEGDWIACEGGQLLGTKVLCPEDSPRIYNEKSPAGVSIISPSGVAASMYADNELLFPAYVIPSLQQSRGEEWSALVERVSNLPDDSIELLAFSLMMIRIDGCLSCETDSYRAMRGCKACSKQSLRRYRGSDLDLVSVYQKALEDVQQYLEIQVTIIIEEPISARAA